MAKKRVGKFPKDFVQRAVARMDQCDDIGALAKELDVHRRLLYTWRDRLQPREPVEGPPSQSTRESTLRKQVGQLKRLLADKTLEIDFFKGALRKVEARRQRSGNSGGKASTRKSGK